MEDEKRVEDKSSPELCRNNKNAIAHLVGRPDLSLCVEPVGKSWEDHMQCNLLGRKSCLFHYSNYHSISMLLPPSLPPSFPLTINYKN